MRISAAVAAALILASANSPALAIDENEIQSALQGHICPKEQIDTTHMPNFVVCKPYEPDWSKVNECQDQQTRIWHLAEKYNDFYKACHANDEHSKPFQASKPSGTALAKQAADSPKGSGSGAPAAAATASPSPAGRCFGDTTACFRACMNDGGSDLMGCNTQCGKDAPAGGFCFAPGTVPADKASESEWDRKIGAAKKNAKNADEVSAEQRRQMLDDEQVEVNGRANEIARDKAAADAAWRERRRQQQEQWAREHPTSDYNDGGPVYSSGSGFEPVYNNGNIQQHRTTTAPFPQMPSVNPNAPPPPPPPPPPRQTYVPPPQPTFVAPSGGGFNCPYANRACAVH
jgi:hypothetical protein